ncbi:alpha-xylosidase [Microbacter margulisiae]|uniref:Alpha-D-xyloside xylohydrolase n=1 Tax=Microbacter margulisiae TaxID=1350067 RepID=A0A7W5DQQ7_9PORP|nr:alpha-xylosidase [Microbacter margulisiae]MBB3187005.1 alpha-D-xyloside xylohydrolase [Microbacter margulisiae]
MKQTNYQLFDFLDFNPALNEGDRLWRACTPTSIEAKEGDILITIPFQQQLNSNEINPDTSVARKSYQMRLRAYGTKIIRAAIGFDTEWMETSAMLQLDSHLTKNHLHFEKAEYEWIVKDSDNQTKAIVDFHPVETDWWSDLVPAPAETINLAFFPDGQHEVKLSAYDMFSPARHDAFALAFIEKDGQPHRATCAIQAKADECFTGTGERFAKMDLSGHTFQLYNQDGQGVNNRRAYKNIPFYLSSAPYGLFLHTTSFAKFSLADHSTRSAQILAEEPVIDLFLIGGDNAEQILYGYRQLTGFPAMPPVWSFGTWMSRMTYFSADEVNKICHRMRVEGYPCDVIHLDTGWFKTDWLCEWKFNEERFPNPKKFIAGLKGNGYRVSLWQLPYISYDAEQYEEANENDYISKSERKISGSSNFSIQDYAGTIDFTYDKATEWYKNLLKRLLDIGVACIKTDFGEDIHLDAKYHSMTPEKLHNLYPLLYQKAAYEITKEVTGDGIIWARAGWAGCQRYPLHWGGDSACSWDGLAGSLKGGLHLGLSGFGFWSHDVPGFHGVPNFMNSKLPEDIYVRWTQFGVFSSHLRYHGSHAREPWLYPNIAPIIKQWLQLRYHLIPYILEQSQKVTCSGYPMIRALLFHHPQDRTCWHIDDQYYFGDNIMVAPVMNPDNRRDIYLPEGKWVHFFTKEITEGARWLRNVAVPLSEMPVYVKYGAEIPFYPEQVNCTDEMNLSKTIKIRFDENTPK